MGRKHSKSMSSRRFEPPRRLFFIFFQGEHKGPKSKILIRARQNPSSRVFIRHALFEQHCVYVQQQQQETCGNKQQKCVQTCTSNNNAYTSTRTTINSYEQQQQQHQNNRNYRIEYYSYTIKYNMMPV